MIHDSRSCGFARSLRGRMCCGCLYRSALVLIGAFITVIHTFPQQDLLKLHSSTFPQTNSNINKELPAALWPRHFQSFQSHINMRLMVTPRSLNVFTPPPLLLCRWFSVILSVTGRDARL